MLGAIHDAGILHRDLKPGNVMLRTEEQLALIDFGMAKQAMLQMELTDKGLIFGTPHYMSPEQGHGQRLDARSDLYSLGVVLFEMLTGDKPYRADNPMTVLYMHRNTPIPRLRAGIGVAPAAAGPAAGEGSRTTAIRTPRKPRVPSRKRGSNGSRPQLRA